MTWDWRTEYVICEHVADDEKAGTRHRGFRVCCEACWNAGFLDSEQITTKEVPPGLCVGRIAAKGDG